MENWTCLKNLPAPDLTDPIVRVIRPMILKRKSGGGARDVNGPMTRSLTTPPRTKTILRLPKRNQLTQNLSAKKTRMQNRNVAVGDVGAGAAGLEKVMSRRRQRPMRRVNNLATIKFQRRNPKVLKNQLKKQTPQLMRPIAMQSALISLLRRPKRMKNRRNAVASGAKIRRL